MNLAVIAAFTAAAISLVNIIVTARLTSGSQFRQWQREEARPITARILALSREARSAWAGALLTWGEWDVLRNDHRDDEETDAPQKVRTEQVAKGNAAYGKLRFELAQLQLIAARPSRDAAAALYKGHEAVAEAFDRHQSTRAVFNALKAANLTALEAALAATFRADLGLPGERTRHHLRRMRRYVARLSRRPPTG